MTGDREPAALPKDGFEAIRALVRILLLLSTLEGMVACLLLFRIPSMERSAWLLGFSAPRIFLGLLASIPVLFLLGLSWKATTQDLWLRSVISRLWEVLGEPNRTIGLTLASASTSLLCALVVGLFTLPLGPPAAYLTAVFERASSFVVWAGLMSLQASFVLLGFMREAHRQGRTVQIGSAFRSCVLALVLTATLGHWLVLILNAPVFSAIRGWFWIFRLRDESRDGLLVVLLAIPLVAVWVTERPNTRTWHKVLTLLLAGYSLQIGFAFLEGGGFESLRSRSERPGGFFELYGRAALQEQVSIDALIRDYDILYGDNYFLRTKPPGVLIVAKALEGASNWVFHETSFEGRYHGLTTLGTYALPVLSLLLLPVLLVVGTRLADARQASLAGLLYISFPNVILFTSAQDQFLYPIIFVLGLCLGTVVTTKRSLLLAFIAGAYVYTAALFSFSLLPLALLLPLWGAIDPLGCSGRGRGASVLRLLLGLVTGFGVAFAAFWLALGYNMFARSIDAMAAHRAVKHFELAIGSIADALLVNNVEFATWIGLPGFLLAGARIGVALVRLGKRRLERLDGMAVAFLITFIALCLSGQTMGEVGRLWIFLAPMYALMAGSFVATHFPRAHSIVYLLVGMELVTAFLIFKYQFPQY